ncbi:hypothetical protein [Nitrososphaera sp.]|uniref:hypothetical protein n=1 Tax=Nitrososphaera sp. TaxID=1971748 RepID=UPI00307CF8CB
MSTWKIMPASGYSFTATYLETLRKSIEARGVSSQVIEVEIDDNQVLSFVRERLNEPAVIIKLIEKSIVLPAPKPDGGSGTTCPSCGGYVPIQK